MKLWCLFPILVATPMALGASPSVVERNNQGVVEFQSDKQYEALKSFNSSLADEPFHGLIHNNLGLTFLKNKEKEKEIEVLDIVELIANAEEL